MGKDNLYLSNVNDCVLVVIDVQEKLVSAMPKGVKERVIERVNVLLTAANTLSVPVVVTEQSKRLRANRVCLNKSMSRRCACA